LSSVRSARLRSSHPFPTRRSSDLFLPDRYIRGECPKCGAKDQYGDACENCSTVNAPTDLIRPYSTVSGATPVLKASEHFFFRLSDRKSTRLNSSHRTISYAVFCLK